MEYFSDIYNFKLLRNYINNDPVCDYFEFQSHLNNSNNYEKDVNNYFNKYINKLSSDYIDNFFNDIITNTKLHYPNIFVNKYNNIDDTINKIKNNVPLIINPILLHDKFKLIV